MVQQVHCSRRILLRRGLEFLCLLSIKVSIRKKSGNLFNDPRTFWKKLKDFLTTTFDLYFDPRSAVLSQLMRRPTASSNDNPTYTFFSCSADFDLSNSESAISNANTPYLFESDFRSFCWSPPNPRVTFHCLMHVCEPLLWLLKSVHMSWFVLSHLLKHFTCMW